MTTSRATVADRARQRQQRESLESAGTRGQEAVLLVFASLVVALGLYLVYAAKTYQLENFDASLRENKIVNLNALSSPTQLLPLLQMFPNRKDQDFVAKKIYSTARHGNNFANVGAIAKIRATETDSAKVPLLSRSQLAQLKPFLVVRDPAGFRRQFWLWAFVYFLPFYAVHVLWRMRQFAGDNLIFPMLHLLSGIGLILMVSLRDPLRDTLTFAEFAQGAAAGCVAMYLFSLPDYERRFSRLTFLPLVVSLLLALALGILGTGPGSSDAKVNLFFFQPMELIRILLVLFLAGYFAQNWDALRQLKQEHGRLAALAGRFSLPRLDYILPVVAGVAASLALFFWVKDLGPALVMGSLFLMLYSIARNRALLALAGFVVIILGFTIGYATGTPQTATHRVEMWRSPWDNSVRGGDQVAHSLWALSTGGVTGTGFGLGNPETVPAAHTDLIISVLGEQSGLLGILGLYALYALLVYRGLRIALNAPGIYSFFLVAGLMMITALQILLISGGLLGLIPLTGVISPFLSFGRTSMLANFILFAMVLAVSNSIPKKDHAAPFRVPVTWLTMLLGAAGVVVTARAAYIQTIKADQTLVRPTLVVQADGVRRNQYNPRLIEIARQLPKGDIFDRNGLPMATNSWSLVAAHQQDYQRLGILLDQTSSNRDRRHYPLGPPLFYLLGDVRTPLKQGASNTAFQERESRVRLRGYEDYQELIPLLRHRYQPDNPAVKEVLERKRDVHMSIDARLQLRASTILRDHLLRMKKQKGAIVVLEPATGDLLAAVSYPWPAPAQFAALNENSVAEVADDDFLDRARYGLYPPGSSFKIVTAMAALRKDPALVGQRFECTRLPDGRVGNFLGNSRRPIRDDIMDKQPHGSVDMAKGIAQSCNAYFAQLGTLSVGPKSLFELANLLEIKVAEPNKPEKLRQALPQASYGQGQVVASPFQMARVAATIANGGNAPLGRWLIDETNPRIREPIPILRRELADEIAGFMRSVVTGGTGRSLGKSVVPIAGKTGTAEVANRPSHAWFIGFAPYGVKSPKQIAFAVLVENGQYGGTAAAPIAGEVVEAARQLGMLDRGEVR